MAVILAADIGGTNARMAIFAPQGGKPRLVFARTYPTARFPDFSSSLEYFLREIKSEGIQNPSKAAIAFAGPVGGEEAQLVNRSAWRVSVAMLEARGMEAKLLNDFEALAHGVAHAAPEDSIVLQEGRAEPRGAIAIVGAGTGLGVAALRWDGARYVPFASEAGHMTFGARDETEFALAQAMRKAHGGRVSAERVVSGPGLARTYGFLARGDASTTGTAHEDPAQISARALADPGSTEARALDLFVRCYGAFAGDVALAFLARGGVWIVGSIAARLRERLSRPDFLAAFNDKGRHRPLAEATPVRLAVNENLGLLGAAWAAF